MAWESTTKISSNLDASTEGGRVWTDIYRVTFTTIDNSPIDAINATGIPQDYQPHVDDVWATNRARSCKYEREGDLGFGKIRLVTCIFRTKADDEDPNEDGEPLNWPAKWTGSFQQFGTDIIVGTDGLPIKNSALLPYTNLPPKDDSRPVLQCQRNFATFDTALWPTWRDKINNAAWGGFPKHTVKLMDISFAEQYTDSTTPYYATTWSFQVQYQTGRAPAPAPQGEVGWAFQFLSEGILESPDNAGDPAWHVEFELENGEKVKAVSPVPLDASGKGIVDPAKVDTDHVYTHHDIYDELDFTTLPIPAPILKA